MDILYICDIIEWSQLTAFELLLKSNFLIWFISMNGSSFVPPISKDMHILGIVYLFNMILTLLYLAVGPGLFFWGLFVIAQASAHHIVLKHNIENGAV